MKLVVSNLKSRSGRQSESSSGNTCFLASEKLSFHSLTELPRYSNSRAHMVRPKQIYHLSVEKLSPKSTGSDEHQEAKRHFCRVIMDTEAGTYIKEFVHGDLGRTNPSFASIAGAAADILELDVLEVDLVWPPHMKT